MLKGINSPFTYCYLGSAANLTLDTTVTTDFDWYYLYTAQDAMVPLPLGYVPIIDDEHVDEGAI